MGQLCISPLRIVSHFLVSFLCGDSKDVCEKVRNRSCALDEDAPNPTRQGNQDRGTDASLLQITAERESRPPRFKSQMLDLCNLQYIRDSTSQRFRVALRTSSKTSASMSSPAKTPRLHAVQSNTNPALHATKRKNNQATNQLYDPHPVGGLVAAQAVETDKSSAMNPAIHPIAMKKSQHVSIDKMRREVQFFPNQGVT